MSTGSTNGHATVSDWLEGARLRTLPLAVAPVLLGTAAAFAGHGAHLGRAVLALLIALGLQIGVNFANDYSDGIRGTDAQRVGPQRLTASGIVPARTVRTVAFAFFAAAALFGLVLVIVSGQYWLIAVGIASIAAAWWYTGGKHPYGYAGLGEVSVFLFFGIVATCATTLTQLGNVTWLSFWFAVAIGLFSCAVLMVNNIRDIVQDEASGKRTLAVRLGTRGANVAFAGILIAAYVVVVVLGLDDKWVWLGLAAVPMHAIAILLAAKPRDARDQITALKLTSVGALVCSALVSLGVVISTLV